MSVPGATRLLIRDLEQLVTPAGRDAPLRGRALADVDWLDDAYVLCEDGLIASVGRMRDLPALDGDVVELDGSGHCAIPGLVDCHTHPCFAGDRVEEFSLRAAGASYEELHAEGGGILSTVRATRAASEDELEQAVRRHAAVDAAGGNDDLRGQVGLRARPGHRARIPPRRQGGGRRPDLARCARRSARVRRCRRRTSTSRSPRFCPRPRGIAEAADVFLERGAFDAAQARRYLEACRDAGLALRLHGDQFSESGAVPLAIELGARSVDHLEATGTDGAHALARSDVVGVLLPVSALFLGRPMPPGRALVDAGAAVALATDFNPGSAFCESLPLVCSLACTQLRLSPAEALAACTVNAAHVLGRADSVGRLAPGFAADVVLLDAPDWRYLAYHLGGDVVGAVVRGGDLAWSRSRRGAS